MARTRRTTRKATADRTAVRKLAHGPNGGTRHRNASTSKSKTSKAPTNNPVAERTNTAGQPAPERGDGPDPNDDGAPRGAGGPDWFAAFYGGLRGTVTVAPGADLTAPAGEEWNAERDR